MRASSSTHPIHLVSIQARPGTKSSKDKYFLCEPAGRRVTRACNSVLSSLLANTMQQPKSASSFFRSRYGPPVPSERLKTQLAIHQEKRRVCVCDWLSIIGNLIWDATCSFVTHYPNWSLKREITTFIRVTFLHLFDVNVTLSCERLNLQLVVKQMIDSDESTLSDLKI